MPMSGKMSQKRPESREERDRWHASAATLLLGHGGETDIRGMHLTWRLILEVLHVWVTAEQLANRDVEQDV
jgi:hypothetical protein